MILVELHPRRMARAGGGTAAGLLARMCELGYCDISHSGAVCDERWLNITRTIRCAVHGVCNSSCMFQLHLSLRIPLQAPFVTSRDASTAVGTI